MKLRHIIEMLCLTMIVFMLACGKDREKPPSNREGYTDASIAAPGAPPKKDDKKNAPEESAPVEESGSYVVEVGSFDSEPEAKDLAEKLRLARINGKVQKAGGKFRVVVGKGFSRSRAEKMLDEVIEAGFGTAKVAPAQAT